MVSLLCVPSTVSTRIIVADMAKTGLPVRVIAEKAGVTRQRVHQLLVTMGLRELWKSRHTSHRWMRGSKPSIPKVCRQCGAMLPFRKTKYCGGVLCAKAAKQDRYLRRRDSAR